MCLFLHTPCCYSWDRDFVFVWLQPRVRQHAIYCTNRARSSRLKPCTHAPVDKNKYLFGEFTCMLPCMGPSFWQMATPPCISLLVLVQDELCHFTQLHKREVVSYRCSKYGVFSWQWRCLMKTDVLVWSILVFAEYEWYVRLLCAGIAYRWFEEVQLGWTILGSCQAPAHAGSVCYSMLPGGLNRLGHQTQINGQNGANEISVYLTLRLFVVSGSHSWKRWTNWTRTHVLSYVNKRSVRGPPLRVCVVQAGCYCIARMFRRTKIFVVITIFALVCSLLS